jgi:amidohydrolase
MEGTFRTMDEPWRKEAHIKMKKIAEGIAESFGGSCDFGIKKGYPFLINDEKLTEALTGFVMEYIGEENVVDADRWMAAEDFAYYSQVTDSCFYLLGTGNKEKGITSSLHTATFDIDEESLSISTGLMAYIALKQLGN